MTGLFTYVNVCVSAGGHAHDTNTGAHGGISMQIEKRRGDRRAWQALGEESTEAAVLVWNPATNSPGLDAQWEWDVGRGGGREC